jgi:hypothetical protein
MHEYAYSIDLPHSAERVWTLMQDYDKWPDFAKPMVTGIEVTTPGDAIGNGLVRRVNYRLPLGLKGKSIETIQDLTPGVGYTYVTDGGTVGTLRLEKLGPDSTRLHFHEKVDFKPPFGWFEGRITKFIEKYNRKTMLNMSQWLTDHPAYGSTSAEQPSEPPPPPANDSTDS